MAVGAAQYGKRKPKLRKSGGDSPARVAFVEKAKKRKCELPLHERRQLGEPEKETK